MKRAPDRKKLRREYLKKKGVAYLSLTLHSLVFVPAFVFAVVFWLMAIGMAGYGVYALMTVAHGHPYQDNVLWLTPAAFFFFSALALCPSLYALATFNEIKDAKKAACLPYVPPVHPNALPADEILVRSSEAPMVAQGEVLLRAARETCAPQEELLRMSVGEQA
jgi:hypothetical protein